MIEVSCLGAPYGARLSLNFIIMTIEDLKIKVATFLRNTRDVKSCATHHMTLDYNDGVEYALTIVNDWLKNVQYESDKL